MYRWNPRHALFFGMAILLPGSALAYSTSYTGTFTDFTNAYGASFSIAGPSTETVTVQTYGFGGGVNAAGDTTTAGGFDPFIGLFSGSGAGAAIQADAFADPYGTSDVPGNYASVTKCPAAGNQGIVGSVCGEIMMSLTLGAGNYTVYLSDAAYIPSAVFDNGTLVKGFTDLKRGAFQTCNIDSGSDYMCATDTGNWAFDVTTTINVVSTPESGSLCLLAVGMLAPAAWTPRKPAWSI